THGLVEVSNEDLLVIEWVLAKRALLETHLCAIERTAVLEPILLERERGVLAGQAPTGVPGRHEVQIALEHVRAGRRGPVAVRDVPAALVDQDLEGREALEVVDAPAGYPRGVDAREPLAEVRRVPRSSVPAAGQS